MSELLAMLVPALGRALLHFLWQGAAVGLAVAVLLPWQRSARTRYAVACAALLACVLLPTATVLLDLAVHAPVASSAVPGGTLSAVAPGALAPAVDRPWWPGLDVALPAIVALWAAGASTLCLRTGIGLLWLRRVRATPQDAALPRWQARLDALARHFDLRGVALRIVPDLDSPVATGWLRPMVLLPAAVIGRMPVESVEALLAHELAHIRRHDYLVNLLQALVEALLFYHPIVWWLSRRIRNERELIADAMAADAIGDPRRLARALAALSVHLAPHRSRTHPAPTAHGGSLMSRIQLLVRPGQQSPRAGRIALPVLGLAAACFAFYAQAQIGGAATAPNAVSLAATPAAGAGLDTGTASAQPAPAAAQVRAEASTQTRAAGRVARSANQGAQDAFALVRKGEDVTMSMSGTTDDMRALETARQGMDGDFVWFRRGDEAYVVTDPSIVERVNAAWRDSSELGEKMNALGREIEVQGKEMAGYAAQMATLATTHAPSPTMRQAQDRMQALAEEQQLLAGQQAKLARDMRKADDPEREAMEARAEELSQQMQALGAQMERQGKIIEAEAAQLERDRQPMQTLGRQMEEAGKPMNALSARMGELGKQQAVLASKAERETQALISEALRKGLVAPAPSAP